MRMRPNSPVVRNCAQCANRLSLLLCVPMDISLPFSLNTVLPVCRMFLTIPYIEMA